MIYPMLSLLLFGAGDLEILATGKDRVELAAAAIRVASAGDGGALESLSSHLGTRAFLERLDESANPQLAQYHLQRVFEALAAHPSPAVERLCLRLADAREFSARGSRMVLLLRALAAVKPMSEAGARLFVRTNANGHYSSNGPLLASNGSPRAMGVLEAMFREKDRPLDERVGLAHRSLVPVRSSLEVARVVDRLASADIPGGLRAALLESLFDYRPAEWFGKAGQPPVAPSWSAASSGARALARSLAARMAVRDDLTPELREKLRDAGKGNWR